MHRSPNPQTSSATPTGESSSLRGPPALSSYSAVSTGRQKQSNSKPKQPTMQKGGYVYIMCNMNSTTLYVGVTFNLAARITKHKENFYPNSFISKFNCKKLVYYKWFDTIIEAIAEEKRIKGGSRKKKEILINGMNSEWNDLYDQIKLL